MQRADPARFGQGVHEVVEAIDEAADALLAADALELLGLEAPEEKVRGQVYNLGSEAGNYTKDEIVAFVLKRLPETVVRYKDLTFGGDMRDITVSFEKVRRELGFETRYTVDDGVREVLHYLRDGIIKNPDHPRYRNAQFLVQ